MNRTKRLLISMLTLLCCCTGAWAQSASDVLSGEFTINASGTKVQFSKGNLQYVNGNWQFAEHQYDYIGNNQSDNNKDLFAFIGYSTPDASWFNMSHDQWKYLLATRSVTNSLSTSARYTMATLGSTYKGLILFPDDYTHPDGTDFVAGTYNGYSNFTATVSLAGWALMEAAGCVFLPAAGYYSSPRKVFDEFGEAVEINTTTSYNSDNYYTPTFKKDQANCDATSNKNSWMSVRLVRFKTNLQQDTDGYYLIGSVQDWKNFAAIVNNEINTAANARMIADIDLGTDQTKIGTADIYYQGTFDGQGHTLTVAYSVTSSSSQHVAPFIKIKNATIQNLHVSGSITTAGMRPASITSYVSGTCYVRNCWSDVAITSSYNKDICAGGLVTRIDASQTLNMDDCIFSGSITLSNNSGYRAGGLIGWTQDGGIANVTNCLVAPSALSTITSSEDNKMFVSGYQGKVTITNCYYNEVGASSNWVVQGTATTGAELSDGTIAYRLQALRANLVWGQRIGTDTKPVLTNEESYRVFRSINGGYTNDPTQACEGLQEDASGYYLIGSVIDWQDFAILVGMTPTANAKMTADINLGTDQTMIGSESTPYQGTFDGQRHTLTVAYSVTSSSSQQVAPFIKIKNATIQNLHVSGSITTAGMRPASITSYVSGTCYVRNCWSDVAITSSRNADICAGGLVTRIDASQTLNMDDCKFSGSITLSTNGGYAAGGLVGWTQNGGIANVTNCLVAPSALSTITSSEDNKMFVSGYQGKVTILNCYYNEVGASSNWVKQGIAATNTQQSDGTIAYKLQTLRSDLVWGQCIGTNSEPALTNVESNRVYKGLNGGYTNNPDEAYLGLQQDEDGYFLIGNIDDWKDFSELVEIMPKANAKMTADIDLGDDQTHISGTWKGESSPEHYGGIFDGQGHTLTVNYNDNKYFKAPFGHCYGATIKNLHVAGYIMARGEHPHTAGVMCNSTGNDLVQNVWVSATIDTNRDAAGAIIGLNNSGASTIRDCLFTGTVKTVNSGGLDGCFLGRVQNGSSNIINCLSTGTFDYYNSSGSFDGTHTNCYVKQFDGTIPDAMQLTEAQLTDGTTATALQAGRSEVVWVQDPVTNQPMLATFANAVTLTEGDDLSALSAYAGKTCKVDYSRSFTESKSSTVCLPFAYTKKEGDGSFYAFMNIEKVNGEYVATMAESESTTLTANTPYLYTPNSNSPIDFSGTYILPDDISASSTTNNGWTFKGTYQTKEWTEAPTGIYGFSAQAVEEQGISQGEFVKVGAYVRIKPMRCYLEYTGSDSQWAGARGMTRAADEGLPETIKVRLIGADGDLTAIGSLSTVTGEVTFDKDAWYSLDGRRIEGKPTVKGIYVNNGKKIVVK